MASEIIGTGETSVTLLLPPEIPEAKADDPMSQRMRVVIDGQAASQVLPKDEFAAMFNYLRNQWDALPLYLSDGRLRLASRLLAYDRISCL